MEESKKLELLWEIRSHAGYESYIRVYWDNEKGEVIIQEEEKSGREMGVYVRHKTAFTQKAVELEALRATLTDSQGRNVIAQLHFENTKLKEKNETLRLKLDKAVEQRNESLREEYGPPPHLNDVIAELSDIKAGKI